MLGEITPAVAKGQDTILLRLILDKTTQRVGKELTNDPGVIADLQTRIGLVYFALGENTNAEDTLRAAVAIRRAIRPNSLELADSLDSLIEPIASQGRYPEAEQIEREALALRTKLLPRKSQEVASSLNNLGFIIGE